MKDTSPISVKLDVGLWKQGPSQYPKRRLFVRSREVSKPRDWYFKLSHRFAIWQAHRQQCCRSACQISERSGNSKYKSRGFETWRDLTERRLFGYWDGALIALERISFGLHVLKKVTRRSACEHNIDTQIFVRVSENNLFLLAGAHHCHDLSSCWFDWVCDVEKKLDMPSW